MKRNAIIALAIINCGMHGMVSEREYAQITMGHAARLELKLVPFLLEMQDTFGRNISKDSGQDAYHAAQTLLTYRMPAADTADSEIDMDSLLMARAGKYMHSIARTMSLDPQNRTVQAILPYIPRNHLTCALSYRELSVVNKMLARKTDDYACALTTRTHAGYACAQVSAKTKKRLADTLAGYYLDPSSFPVTSSAFALLQHPALVSRLAADTAAIDESMKEFHRVARCNKFFETSIKRVIHPSLDDDSETEYSSGDEEPNASDVLLGQDWLSNNKV